MGTKETVWIDVHIKTKSEAAIRVDNGHKTAWIPKAAVIDSEDDLEVGTHTQIEIALWLAEEKELV